MAVVVKCLNSRCPEYLEANYIIETFRDRAGNKLYDIQCPVCNTGYSKYNVAQFRALVQESTAATEKKFEKKLKEERKEIGQAYKDKKVTKEKARELLESKESKLREKYFGAEEAGKWSTRKKEDKEIKKEVKALGVPTTPVGDYIKKVLPSIYFAFGGLIVAALLGSPAMFFAALLFGFYTLIPAPDSIKDVHEEAERIKKDFERRIREARAKGAKAEEIRNIIEVMKAETEMEKLLVEVQKKKGWTKVSGMIVLKDVFKSLGFILAIISLLTNRVIPFAGLAGLVLGFIAYYSFGSLERKPEKES